MTTQINIVFMRHGRSLADDEEVHEGRYDSPLTEVGQVGCEEDSLIETLAKR